MSVGLFLAVAGGGLVGAPCRFLADRAVTKRVTSDLPWGTFAINVSGALLFGLLTGLASAGHLPTFDKTLFGTGFCGAFTTFSTFSYETMVLVEDGRLLEALGNMAGSLAVGLAAAGAGLAIGLAT